jgi:hypothetical protein
MVKLVVLFAVAGSLAAFAVPISSPGGTVFDQLQTALDTANTDIVSHLSDCTYLQSS